MQALTSPQQVFEALSQNRQVVFTVPNCDQLHDIACLSVQDILDSTTILLSDEVPVNFYTNPEVTEEQEEFKLPQSDKAVQHPLENGTVYFSASATKVVQGQWDSDEIDFRLLKQGRVFLNPKDAIEHHHTLAQAMIKDLGPLAALVMALAK